LGTQAEPAKVQLLWFKVQAAEIKNAFGANRRRRAEVPPRKGRQFDGNGGIRKFSLKINGGCLEQGESDIFEAQCHEENRGGGESSQEPINLKEKLNHGTAPDGKRGML